jgi:hypothetical protein
VLLSLEHIQSPYRKENINIEGNACLVNPFGGNNDLRFGTYPRQTNKHVITQRNDGSLYTRGCLIPRWNKILHQDKEKTNIQTKVPPILRMARIIAQKKHEQERERERERSVRVYLSIYEGR